MLSAPPPGSHNPPNDGAPVKPNQRVRIRFINESMMFHPFHFHGHTFQVMNGDVAKARKDTVPPPQHLSPRGGHGVEAGMAFFVEYAG